MTHDFDELDDVFGSASSDLKSQLHDIDIPEFRPRNDGARALAVVAVLAVAAFLGLPWLADALGTPTSIDTAEVPQDGTVDPDPDGEGVAPADLEASEGFELITGFDTTPPATGGIAAQDGAVLGDHRADPAYGSLVRRITDAGEEQTARVTSSFSSVENADGSRVLILSGQNTWSVIDRASLSSTELDTVARRSEPHWHPTDPNLIRHFPDDATEGQLMLLESNLDGSTDLVVDLSSRVTELFPTAVWLTSGSPQDPALGSLYAWGVLDVESELVGLVSYDLSTDTILGSAPAPTEDYGAFRAVRISPSGTHIVLGFGSNTLVYDSSLELQRVRGLQYREGALVAMDDASDALLTVNLGSGAPTGGSIYWEDLETGERTVLFDLFDGANTNVDFAASPSRPGWAVLATHGCSALGAWSCDKLMGVHLASATLANLAHTYSCDNLDLSTPVGSLSPDFERLYFNSDSTSCEGPVDTYELEVPATMFDLVE